MKRSLLTVAVVASVFALGACGPRDTESDIEPVEELEPAPAPAPAPSPMPMDTLHMDTVPRDTMHMPPTGTGM
jgi:hypothetical protein